MRFGKRRAGRGGSGESEESQEACARRPVGGNPGRRRSAAAVTGCSALDGVLLCRAHLSPCAGPALQAPLPGFRRRARPPGAAASFWVGETDSQDPRLRPSAPTALVGPSPAIPGPESRSCLPVRWLPPPAAAAVPQPQHRKVPNPGGGAAGGDLRARLHPPSQRSPPPLPWTDDRTHFSVKTPTSGGSGNAPGGSTGKC